MNQHGKSQDAPGAATTPDLPDGARESPADRRRSEARRPEGLFRALSRPGVALPILIALGAALFLVNLGGYPFYTKGEPREALTVQEIVRGGGVILPMRAGIELPSKPLMMHWMAALVSVAAGGVDELTVRLPTALLAIGAILVCYLYVRLLFDDRIGLLSALMLATSFQFLQAGSGARVDMTLTFFMEVAFFEFIAIAEGLSARWVPLYLSVALAVLTKGPVGLVLPALVGIVWIAARRRWDLLGRLHLRRGVALIAVVAGGWYLAATIVGGTAFVEKQIVAENLFRLLPGGSFHEGHAHPFYYLELALMAGFMPWTPMIALAAIQAARRPRRLGPRAAYLIVWFLTVLIFYSLAQSKRGIYLLALYPALTTLVAIYLIDAVDDRSAVRRWVRGLSVLGGAIYVALGITAIAAMALFWIRPSTVAEILPRFSIEAARLPLELGTSISYNWLPAVLLALAAGAIGFHMIRARLSAAGMVAEVAGGLLCCTVIANLIVVPAVARTLSPEGFTDRVVKVTGGAKVGYLGALNYAVAYYSRSHWPIVNAKDREGPPYLVGWKRSYNRLEPTVRARFEVVAVSDPTSLDGSGRLVLLRRVGTTPRFAPGSTPTSPGRWHEVGLVGPTPGNERLHAGGSVGSGAPDEEARRDTRSRLRLR